MGIHGLFQLLKAEAPDCYKEIDKKTLINKVVAIDSSILLYQFLVQIRTNSRSSGYGSQQLVNDNGEITSHLQGFWNRTANLLENGIKPIFVFDGKPPALKFAELAKRRDSKKKALDELNEATERAENAENSEDEIDAIEDMDKAAKRNIHVSKQQTEDVKNLLRLMGIPVVEAPGEAEAQCAELVKNGTIKSQSQINWKIYATSTEDMDSLTFGTPVVLRKLTMPESAKEKVIEINMSKVLIGLGLSYDEFIDFCILCGCDYCETIKGIGPKTALKMIRVHKNIETVIENLPKRYTVPSELTEKLDEVRNLFKNPNVKSSTDIEITFGKPDRDALVDFLVSKNGFNRERVNKVLDKISGPKKIIKIDEKQPTIDNFFKVKKNS